MEKTLISNIGFFISLILITLTLSSLIIFIKIGYTPISKNMCHFFDLKSKNTVKINYVRYLISDENMLSKPNPIKKFNNNKDTNLIMIDDNQTNVNNESTSEIKSKSNL